MNAPRSSAPVARLVAAGLDRTTAAIHAVPADATPDRREHVRWAEQLHRLYSRRARWWAVLERAGTTDETVPTVYLRAVVQARCAAESHAAEWAQVAEHWADQVNTTGRTRNELVRGASA